MSDDPDPCRSNENPRISVAVTLLDPDWPRAVPAVEDLARRAAEAALAAAADSGAAKDIFSARDAEISLVLADDATLRRHNRDYRNIDKPTNVLAFAVAETPGVADMPGESEGPLLLGDVLLAAGIGLVVDLGFAVLAVERTQTRIEVERVPLDLVQRVDVAGAEVQAF